MPATSPRLATDRQRRFIAALVEERGGIESLRDPLATSAALAANGTLTSRDASSAIERLLAMPRTRGSDRRAPIGNVAPAGGEQVPAPSTGTRAGRMLLAGGVEATATMRNGEHVTVSIRTRKRSGRGWANASLGEQDSRTSISVLGSKVGWLNVDETGRLLLTLRTRREEFAEAIRSIFEHAAGTTLRPTVTRVQEASRCGRCFLTLTDPVSIDRGIGPDCLGRDTGSQHVAAERRAAGSDVRPEPTTRPSLTALVAAAEGRGDDLAQVERWEAQEAAFAETEQERQMQALETVADALIIPQATTRRVDSTATDAARARDLIAEALDAYFGEPELSFALGIFDQLAAR